MGQTLTHGVYLPDEGERNCYSGLAANWQILDTSVGTIAEHTAALAGKAPLVHTHTKSDITNFPAYGNAAGTICEGNDSRLSDARTPVAHTHGKADITDLFNSANTWTENNTFSKQVCLTKVNDTSLKSQNSRAELGETNLSGDTYTQISFEDKNGDNFGYLRQIYGADGNNGFHFFVRNKFLNGAPDPTGTVDYSYFGLRLNPDKSKEAVFKASLRPYDSINSYNLGDATYQWNNLYAKQVNTQSVNGINPGALSLPGAFDGINNQIKNPDGQLNAIDLNGGNNTWVSDVDCYLYFYIPNNKFTWIRIFWPATLVRCGQTFVPVPNESSDYSGFVPVPANTTVVIQIKGTQAPTFRRSACLGNV